MADFKWHLMAEETPQVGDYVILGFSDGTYFATRFKGYDDEVWSVDSRGHYHFRGKAKAWAKIPLFEVSE